MKLKLLKKIRNNRFLIKLSKGYIKLLPYLISILLAFILAPLLFCLSFYIHEAGHIAYGFFDNLISKGIIAKFEISSWIECPILKILKLPQQTRIIHGDTSINYAFGGILLTLLLLTGFSYYYFKISKNKYKKVIFIIPILFFLHEFLGNFLCGTDNLNGNPYQICNNNLFIDYIVKSLPFLLMIPIFLLLIPHMVKFIKKLQKLVIRKK